ncbi:hypothetical protein AB0J84_27890 [Micromonospora arborensis]
MTDLLSSTGPTPGTHDAPTMLAAGRQPVNRFIETPSCGVGTVASE